MKRNYIFFYLLFILHLNYHAFSQESLSRIFIPVIENSKELINPWAGGINYPQVSSIDLNFDNKNDLVVFDRNGNRILPFLRNSGDSLIYSPAYVPLFPKLEAWVLLRDFNCDGKKDIFAHTTAGIEVYKNVSNGSLQFQKIITLLKSDYNGDLINLYVSSVDIPAIDDIDGDGDLDILTFVLGGSSVEFHKNYSKEIYQNCDSLNFILETSCFGKFQEDISTNSVTLGVSCKGITSVDPQGQELHSGSSVLSFDSDGDGDKELLLGDISFNNMVFLLNGGSSSDAVFTNQEPNYPASFPINIPLFPAAFFEDVNNDQQRDLIVGPNAGNLSENNKNIWLYENSGSDLSPVLSFSKNNFLIDEMIDVGEGAYPVLMDINKDGLIDLLVGNFGYYSSSGKYSSSIAYYKNKGTVSKPRFELITRDLGNISSYLFENVHPSFGDLDNDGDPDLIIGEKEGKLHYFTNVPDLNNEPEFSLKTPSIGGIDVGLYASPFLNDINGDMLLDLVIGERNGNLNYYQNNGTINDPAFQFIDANFGKIDVTGPGLTGYSIPAIYEENGKKYLFCGAERGTVFLFTDINAIPGATFTKVDSIFGNIESGLRSSMAIADLTGDKIPEYIIGNYSGGLSLYSGPVSVGVREQNLIENFIIFPNPVKNSLFFKNLSPSEEGILSFYNLIGENILNLPAKEVNNNPVDVSKFGKGIYFCILKSASGIICKKFIIF